MKNGSGSGNKEKEGNICGVCGESPSFDMAVLPLKINFKRRNEDNACINVTDTGKSQINSPPRPVFSPNQLIMFKTIQHLLSIVLGTVVWGETNVVKVKKQDQKSS